METEKAEKDFSPKVAGVFIVLAIVIKTLNLETYIRDFFDLPASTPNGLFEMIIGLIKMVMIFAVYHFATSFAIKKIFQTEPVADSIIVVSALFCLYVMIFENFFEIFSDGIISGIIGLIIDLVAFAIVVGVCYIAAYEGEEHAKNK